MTWFRWWHKHVRFHFRPRSEEHAQAWTRKLSLAYAFCAWNILAIILYQFVGRNKIQLDPEEKLLLSPGQQLAKEMGRENAQVLTVKGFKVTRQPKVGESETKESEQLE